MTSGNLSSSSARMDFIFFTSSSSTPSARAVRYGDVFEARISPHPVGLMVKRIPSTAIDGYWRDNDSLILFTTSNFFSSAQGSLNSGVATRFGNAFINAENA